MIKDLARKIYVKGKNGEEEINWEIYAFKSWRPVLLCCIYSLAAAIPRPDLVHVACDSLPDADRKIDQAGILLLLRQGPVEPSGLLFYSTMCK